ncbi:MAG: App1 family protein [Actinomycetota bacterium]
MASRTGNGDDLQEKAAHIGMRVEDRWQAYRERRARRRGYVATVMPFTGYGTAGWIRVLGRVVMARPGAFDNGRMPSKLVADGIRGWRNFISPPAANARVTISAAGIEHHVVADRGGVVDAKVSVDLAPGWHTVTLRCEGSEPVEAAVYVVPPGERFGVVSDVDDTVMVTALPRPLLAAWNTFVLDEHARNPTPGMAVMLERVTREHPGSPVLYLSTGAWNVAQTLTRFLSRNLYPDGALLLTDWGPTKDRWFRSGQGHKVDQLRRLAEEFPDIKWLLIGDDGQHDEAIYAGFALRYPGHVAAIAIRQLSVSEAVLAGGRSQDRPSGPARSIPWIYAPDGKGLANQLQQLGIL